MSVSARRCTSIAAAAGVKQAAARRAVGQQQHRAQQAHWSLDAWTAQLNARGMHRARTLLPRSRILQKRPVCRSTKKQQCHVLTASG